MKSLLEKNAFVRKLLITVFWLCVWQIAYKAVSQELYLVSPSTVFLRLIELMLGVDFWLSIGNSLLKIFSGFFLAVLVGIVLAGASYAWPVFFEFISPVLAIVKSTPVASFTILSLVWIKSSELSTFISFFMAMPVIYFNIYNGLKNTDIRLLQMAAAFKFSNVKKIYALYMPSVMPYFISAASTGLSFSWKSGIAAELIGLSKSSIGMNLYDAKIFLVTADIFAWTVVIILLSVGMEKMVMLLVKILRMG